MTENELHWLAGLLEGEGTFLSGPPSRPRSCTISLQMCDEDIVARVAAMFGVAYHRCRTQRPHHKPPYRMSVRGLHAARVMEEIKPLMGARRQRQIETALQHFVSNSRSQRVWPEVEAMKGLRANGFSNRAISRSFGVSRTFVDQRLR